MIFSSIFLLKNYLIGIKCICCFRFLFGVSLFLLLKIEMFNGTELLSSLLRGISISTYSDRFRIDAKFVFVPSTGYLYFYGNFRRYNKLSNTFSSPLRGISISTTLGKDTDEFLKAFSSPLRGISISTCQVKTVSKPHNSFRPLYGVSLFLLDNEVVTMEQLEVFVPSTGYLYFYLC